MLNQRGFSLVELLIVVSIVAIISSIAVPNIFTARMAANEAGTMASLRSYGSAQMVYSLTNSQGFGSIVALVTAGMLDNRWSNGSFSGYNYVSPTTDGAAGFECDATPIAPGQTGRFNYRITTDQQILMADAGPVAGAGVGAGGGAPVVSGNPIPPSGAGGGIPSGAGGGTGGGGIPGVAGGGAGGGGIPSFAGGGAPVYGGD